MLRSKNFARYAHTPQITRARVHATRFTKLYQRHTFTDYTLTYKLAWQWCSVRPAPAAFCVNRPGTRSNRSFSGDFFRRHRGMYAYVCGCGPTNEQVDVHKPTPYRNAKLQTRPSMKDTNRHRADEGVSVRRPAHTVPVGTYVSNDLAFRKGDMLLHAAEDRVLSLRSGACLLIVVATVYIVNST